MNSFKHNSDEYFKKLSVYNIGSRTDASYVHWKQVVLQMGGYMCKACGSTSKLVVHHVDSFTDKPTGRVDIANGVVLCTSCHKDYHRSYSKPEDITKETFSKWLYKRKEK